MTEADKILFGKQEDTAAPASRADQILFGKDDQPEGNGQVLTGEELRAPTLYEKAGMAWEKATGGLFSSGPKSTPLPEGIKMGWGDIPHVAGGMVVENLLNPGNILLAATGLPLAARAPAIAKAVGNAFGAGMIGKAVYDIPDIYREWKNPDVSAAKATTDTAAEVAQMVMGKSALNLSRTSNLAGAPAEALHSLASAITHMGDEQAGTMIAQLHGATPLESAELLQKIAAVAPPEAAEHLTAASKALQDMHDAQPAAVKKLNALQKVGDDFQKIFAPSLRGPAAEITAGILREHGASIAQSFDRVEKALSQYSSALMKLPPDERWAVVDDIENGRKVDNEDLQGFADTVRKTMDGLRDEIRGLGTGKLEHFIEDYFPHIWKDPEAAADAFKTASGKRPLEGSKSFLKERSIPTIAEGMRPKDQGGLGLEPASDNPIDLVLLKAKEMQKYLAGQKVMAELKGRGMVTFVKAGEIPGPGMKPIDDRIATVYGPRNGAVGLPEGANIEPEDVTVHGQRIMGKYYAPEQVATVMNNYLSPGLRGSASFRGYLTLANSINQFQLGFSAFHLGFTTQDVMTSKLASALEQAYEGAKTGNVKMMAKAVGKAASVPISPITNLFTGSRGVSEWMKPGSQGAEIAKIMDAYRMGGGRAKMDEFHQATMWKQMTNALHTMGAAEDLGGKVSGAASAAWRAPFAIVEKLGEPLMKYVVPRQKVGIAMDMLKFEMERMPKDATVDDVRKAAGKVIDSVDNRMGQMVYDNLFWHKATKDIAMASVRSVGWNLGTIRELGGGAVDTAKFLNNTLTPGQKAEFTHRMAYAIALPATTMMTGAIYSYLKTGKGPEELKDYFAPKTGEVDPQGRDVRMVLPTYSKDVMHYAHDPVGTLTGKLHPALAVGYEMLKNEDFFGREIRNSDDELMQQLIQTAQFVGKNFEPMSLRNYQTSASANQTTSEKIGTNFGITRAPAWMGETDAEQLAGKLAGQGFKSKDSPDSERVQNIQQAKLLLRQGKDTEANDLLDKLEDGNEISSIQRKNIERGTDHTYLENAVKHLEAKDIVRVFKQATLAERREIADTVQERIDKAHIPDEDRQKLQAEFDKLNPPDRDIDTTLR